MIYGDSIYFYRDVYFEPISVLNGFLFFINNFDFSLVMVAETENKKSPNTTQEPTVVDLDPPHVTGTNSPSHNGIGYNKFSRRLSNVSNAIQNRILGIREEGNFTLGISVILEFYLTMIFRMH